VPALLIAKLVGAAVIAAGLFWLVDEIGDRREAKVYRRINQAIEKTNVDVRHLNSLDEKMHAIAEDARMKALSSIQPSECKASPDQAKSLTRIR
jgi:hypothetical protein